jgi:hypothetical protein
MATPAVTPDQFQYIKLPDGSYGKFRADASDDVIRNTIAKDFPDAFKRTRKGFIERGGGDLLDAGKGIASLFNPEAQDDLEQSIVSAGGGIPGGAESRLILPFLRAGRGYYKGVRNTLDKAEAAAKKGNTAESMIESVAAGLPLVGQLVSGIYEQSGHGDLSGDLGLATSRIAQAASMAPEGSPIPNPVSGLAKTTGRVGTAARAVAKEAIPATARAADTALPWILKPRETAFNAARAKLREIGKVDKKTAAPAEEAPAPEVIPSAPYRMSGSQIPDAVTVTPRAPFLPKGLLKAGPSEAVVTQTEPVMTSLKGKTTAAQQAEVFKKMGVAAPKASVSPMAEIPEGALTPRTDMTFPGVKNGESAAMHQLSDYSINELRAIAVQRGIAIKAADTHGVLIKRIGDTLTESEINEFAQAAAESQRFQKLPWKRQIQTKSQPQVPTSDSHLAKLLKQSVKEISGQSTSAPSGKRSK